MVILGIETATPRLSASLLDDSGGFTGERATSARSSHCELISGFIQELLDEAGLDITGIGCVAVSAGPGSFTGLRIGIATAMGLAYGLGIDVCAVPTLAGLAWGAAPAGSLVCPLVDARRREAYTAVYRITGNESLPETVVKPAAMPLPVLAQTLDDLHEPVVLTGPAAGLFTDALLPSCPAGSTVTPPDRSEPTALAIAEIGRILVREGRTVAPAALTPIYLRRSDAEIARNRHCSS